MEDELTTAIRRQFLGQNGLLAKLDSSGSWTKLKQSSTKQLRFPNAIPVLGIKHICDNLMDSCLSSMESHLGLLQPFFFKFKLNECFLGFCCNDFTLTTLIVTACVKLRWPQFLDDIRQLEHLLRDRLMRERFQATCIPEDMTADVHAFKSWGISLKSLRWEQTVNFCSAVSWHNLCVSYVLATN